MFFMYLPDSKRVENLDRLFRALTSEQRAELYNGCGSAVKTLKVFRLPCWVSLSFQHCCAWHDVAYYVGGTPKDRAAADHEFFKRCIKVAWRESSPTLLFWAFVAWRAVRRGGWLSFVYRRKPRTLAQLVAVAQGEE